jgi:Mce-associated membrane protein
MADDADAAEGKLNESTPHDLTDDAAGSQHSTDDGLDPPPGTPQRSRVRLALIVGSATVVALGGVIGWLGYRTHESRQSDKQWNLFLQVGKQGALNLTTIDWQHADSDVQRILDSSTGGFYDDFAKRSPAFIEVVKQAKSISQGTVTEVGLESEEGDQAQVLAAVTVKVSNAGAPEAHPKMWRMRIGVQKVGDGVKVSSVQFVP